MYAVQKRRNKTIFIRDYLCGKSPKINNNKTLGIKNAYRKFIQVNIQVNCFTNDKQLECEIQKTVPFTMVSKKTKYLGINLTQLYNLNSVQGLYMETTKS